MKLNFDVSSAIAGKYEIVNTQHPIYYSKIGKFDFRTITEDEAKSLVESGSIYIKPIKKQKQQ
ncbi:hypothetical protein [Pedobacter antarcticus]|uniref:hypothetical protein n=1 Tax=Pedobacter antarcticus TaxID=34086 RepID=UPI00292EF301|nr:hypothetical protein [Pedobacter antarcticus]